MTVEERCTTYAYALVNMAKDNLDHAYRVLYDDGKGPYKDLPEVRKGFCAIDIPLDRLASALSKEMGRITSFEDESIKNTDGVVENGGMKG